MIALALRPLLVLLILINMTLWIMLSVYALNFTALSSLVTPYVATCQT